MCQWDVYASELGSGSLQSIFIDLPTELQAFTWLVLAT